MSLMVIVNTTLESPYVWCVCVVCVALQSLREHSDRRQGGTWEGRTQSTESQWLVP